MRTAAEGYGPPSPPIRERLMNWAEHDAPIMNLDSLRPTERHHSILDINFADWHIRGVDTWFFDAEGTFTEHDWLDPTSEIIEHVRKAREQGFIKNIALVSNKRLKDDMSYIKLAWWTHQLGADIAFTPIERGDRKPSSRMMLKAMHFFGSEPDQCAAVDDKYTAGILSANRAGIRSVKVDRLGNDDVPGDKWITRPFEEIVDIGLRHTPPAEGSISPFTELPLHSLQSHREEANMFVEREDDAGYEARHKKLSPEVVALSNKIVGYGDCPAVKLPQEIEDAIPPSWHKPLVDPLRDFMEWYQGKIDAIDPRIRQRYHDFMYENGDIVADIKSLVRPTVIGPLKADAIRDGKYGRALIYHALNIYTDVTDGRDKRRSKRGPNKLGAWGDQLGDKVEEYLSTKALVDVGAASEEDVDLRLYRNIGVVGVRLLCEAFNIDTKALLSGKVSTGGEMTATTLSLITLAVDRHVSKTKKAQHVATGLKLYSGISTAKQLIEAVLKRRYEQSRLPDITAELTAAHASEENILEAA